MKCPHCLQGIQYSIRRVGLGTDKNWDWLIDHFNCPLCYRIIIRLVWCNKSGIEQGVRLIFPKSISRQSLPSEVPDDFADDYKEACLVLADSPKASAALTRRCLQHILREKAKVKHGALADEIQEVIDNALLPADILTIVDAVRVVGNFSAHPIKSQTTGEIVTVELGEAELNLDVIEALFDFYFVRPAVVQAKKDALNKKLADAGKPPIK